MHSRTPSPSKSPSRPNSRLALSSKDGNIRLSPTKNPLRASSSNQISPSRPKCTIPKSSSLRSIFNKDPPVLGFTIFHDPKDYSTELQLSSVKINDENDFIGNRENILPKNSGATIASSSLNKKQCIRNPLQDKDIQQYPGYIEYTASPRIQNRYQLDTLWKNDNKREIPSYVTPPRNDRVKYISFGVSKEERTENGIKRSCSMNDVDTERSVKKLVFNIHEDN